MDEKKRSWVKIEISHNRCCVPIEDDCQDGENLSPVHYPRLHRLRKLLSQLCSNLLAKRRRRTEVAKK
jgi:hypothetical protein